MAGRARSRPETVYCPYTKVDGGRCGRATPPGWDYCAVHAPRRGAEILKESTERVQVTVSIPRFDAPLGGITRSQWEAVRIEMCGITLPPERVES